MLRVGFEPMTPVFEKAKAVLVLDCVATVINTIILMPRVIIYVA
jgi:hypothetical protein